jgi:hypothetical protein
MTTYGPRYLNAAGEDITREESLAAHRLDEAGVKAVARILSAVRLRRDAEVGSSE